MGCPNSTPASLLLENNSPNSAPASLLLENNNFENISDLRNVYYNRKYLKNW